MVFQWAAMLAVILTFCGCGPKERAGVPKPPTVIYLQKDYTGTPGSSCAVVDGPNKGKTGKYDNEGSCCGTIDSHGDEGPGSWGCTDCKTAKTDNGKCADAKKLDHLEYVDALGNKVFVIKN